MQSDSTSVHYRIGNPPVPKFPRGRAGWRVYQTATCEDNLDIEAHAHYHPCNFFLGQNYNVEGQLEK